MADETYKRVLERADQFFRSVSNEQPQHLQCGRGCTLCCYGLFEIGAADVAIIADGLSRLHPNRRSMIIRRAQAIIDETNHPNLRESTRREKEAFFDQTASTPCPNLAETGECLIYDSRPLVCRTFGLPVRDGKRYIGDICDLNFRDASDVEKLTASWDLQWEDAVGPEDAYSIPEAIVLAARMRGWTA
ncbi:MAG: YkgJ family cysteine cluster protein [Thermoanaerobaculia bacterium]